MNVAESNFPPDKECVSHRVLYNCFKRIANKCAPSLARPSYPPSCSARWSLTLNTLSVGPVLDLSREFFPSTAVVPFF